MLEKALQGNKTYWGWIGALLVLIGIGFGCYLYQLNEGLTITGLSRDVSWGFYIAQFTILVGVAASGVMLVLPYYLHGHKPFGRLVIYGEFLAVAAVIMCLLFIVVDLGQPQRLMNVLLHPTPNSILFWDMVVLNGYLFLNIVIGWSHLHAEKKGIRPPSWVKPLIYLSIPWAISIHTVTAFLYAGLPGRHFWLTAILAARFLASAFACGPALLLLILFIVRRVSDLVIPREAIQTLSKIITYAWILNLFFLALELFTGFYSNLPGHMHSFEYLFAGHHGYDSLVPWMWNFVFLAVTSLILMVNPGTRNNQTTLIIALIMMFVAGWIDKGLGLIIGGFVPNPFEGITEYWPTIPEAFIAVGVYAAGFLILTVLYKITLEVRRANA
ncbi:MAG TPA: menaquinol oxidoreductase [Desulfonatronum sp.]|nr:menaquinol oxidoreductase [Desulfonatronum sp.]